MQSDRFGRFTCLGSLELAEVRSGGVFGILDFASFRCARGLLSKRVWLLRGFNLWRQIFRLRRNAVCIRVELPERETD
ncbi:MAG: hypothetical protein ACI835_003564 [Planctomycetota bacterium]